MTELANSPTADGQNTRTNVRFLPMLGWLVAAAVAGGWIARTSEAPRSQPAATPVSPVGAAPSALDQKIANLDQRLKSLQLVTNQLVSETSQYASISLDPTSKAFLRLDANGGTFYVSLENVQPYVSGQKLALRIGNPQSATFRGFELTFNWGKFGDPDYEKKRKTEQSSAVLQPGSWTRVEAAIAPATADDIQGGVTMSMTTNTVSLASR